MPVPITNVLKNMTKNDEPTNNTQKEPAKKAPKEVATEPPAEVPEEQAGGAIDTKVIIGAKKPRHIKVILTKKRARTPDAPPSTQPAPQKSRKVQLGMRRLRKTVTKARKIKKTAAQLPIAAIRAELVKEKIIKESSKAPEHILRQMYVDAKTVSTKSV
jgi:hypothetical protein